MPGTGSSAKKQRVFSTPSSSATVFLPPPTPCLLPYAFPQPPLSPPLQASPVRHAPTPRTKSTFSSAGQTITNVAKTNQCLRPLSEPEIRQRTFEILKDILSADELERLGWDKYSGSTADTVKESVETIRACLGRTQSRTAKMNKVFQYVDKYSKVIGTAIQHQPKITALVWAGVQMGIQVCVLVYRNSCPVARSNPTRIWRGSLGSEGRTLLYYPSTHAASAEFPSRH